MWSGFDTLAGLGGMINVPAMADHLPCSRYHTISFWECSSSLFLLVPLPFSDVDVFSLNNWNEIDSCFDSDVPGGRHTECMRLPSTCLCQLDSDAGGNDGD